MQITDFTENHIEEAISLAKANYEEERCRVPLLPEIDTIPGLPFFAKNSLGVAGFENGKMAGFLCCYPPMDDAFRSTGVRGTYSPAQAHGAVKENRSRTYIRLYQAAAEKWVKGGIASHAVAVYPHDSETVQTFFTSSFGLRIIEAVRPMEVFDCPGVPGYEFRELAPDRRAETVPLKNLLINHLGKSPVFMCRPEYDEDVLEKEFESRRPRYFSAYYQGEMVAWIETMSEGENFASCDTGFQNICGAYCLEEHRGKGVYQNLLNHAITLLRKEGYTRLGVELESFNPTAFGFWLKYFTPYLYGMVRRIDDKAFRMYY